MIDFAFHPSPLSFVRRRPPPIPGDIGPEGVELCQDGRIQCRFGWSSALGRRSRRCRGAARGGSSRAARIRPRPPSSSAGGVGRRRSRRRPRRAALWEGGYILLRKGRPRRDGDSAEPAVEAVQRRGGGGGRSRSSVRSTAIIVFVLYGDGPLASTPSSVVLVHVIALVVFPDPVVASAVIGGEDGARQRRGAVRRHPKDGLRPTAATGAAAATTIVTGVRGTYHPPRGRVGPPQSVRSVEVEVGRPAAGATGRRARPFQ
mmetsp:Transcript_62872/g.185697  ORF Transcript_62872/g.185697 Transcript_62872/m.185697 type:complete len:260 (-) Transcript_62872:351-1130(-)